VGVVDPLAPAALSERFQGKSALVVGATRGIGRGIALALAKAGASVKVVGRSKAGGDAVVAAMVAAAPSATQTFKAYPYDLFTIEENLRLVRELQSEQARFDFVVLTIGMWPDFDSPNTKDGINKVLALDVVARFILLRGAQPLLKPGARVMSVLASTTLLPLPSVAAVKATLAGEGGDPGFGALAVAAVAMDALLQQAAARFPGVSFVGTQPGVVSTDIVRTTLPGWVANVHSALMSSFALSEEGCGETHLQVLASPNVERRGASYFLFLEGRETQPLAYDEEFGTWAWSHLESLVAKHS